MTPEKKKTRRVVIYVVPAMADKIKEAGGSPFIARLVERALGA